MMIKDAILEYERWKGLNGSEKTLKGYISSLKHFALYLRPTTHVEEITILDVSDWFNHMVEMGWKQNSFLPKASALRDFFSFLRRMRIDCITPEAVPIPRKEHGGIRTLSDQHYVSVVRYLEAKPNTIQAKRDRAMIALLWDTGMRVGELVELNIEQVQECKAVIKTEKTRHKRPFRSVHWSKGTQIFVDEWLKHRLQYDLDHTALFVSLDRRGENKRITTRSVQRVVKEVSQNIGIDFTPHTLRHSKAHQIIEKGGSGADVMNILGHSNISSSSRYVETFGSELEERAQKFL